MQWPLIIFVFVAILVFIIICKPKTCTVCNCPLSSSSSSSSCGGGDCPECSITDIKISWILDQFVEGCIHRIRAITRKQDTTKENIRDFLLSGAQRLVIVSDKDLHMLSHENIKNIRLSTIRSVSLGDSSLSFSVMGLINGRIDPLPRPVDDFDSAYSLFEKTANKNNPESFVLFIDESLNCD